MGHPLFGPHTPFLALNVENKYSAHISVTYSRYVISLVEIHQVVSEESHRTDRRTNERTNERTDGRTDGTHEYYIPPATLAGV